ncbi:MAG: amino acid ABC transporter permease [Trueperaceae bacterium]|nr:amino acid ABC transporter permease [Trueperaceae bacterium]
MSSPPDPAKLVVVRPFPWRRLAESAIVLIVLGFVLYRIITSGVVNSSVIARYIFSPTIMAAVWNTLWLATLGTVIALVLGIVVALMRVSQNRVLSWVATGYIFFFRGTPMLIQLLFWFNAMPVIMRRITIEIPLINYTLLDVPTISVITPFVAALVGLSLAETGYMAEVVRSGMLGVDKGQRDAARALGVPDNKIMWRIVIPQGLRIVMPSIGNQYIMMLKNTSLAMVIGYAELLRRTSDIYSVNFRVMELLTVATFWYLLLTTLVSILQQLLEKWFPAR